MARAWSVSHTVVYQILEGEKDLTNDRIAALPPLMIVRLRRILDALPADLEVA